MWRPVTEEELLLYVDGRLPSARADAVASHLEANPREATRIAAYCRQNELLLALGAAIAIALPPAGEERLKRIVERHAARARRRRNGTVAAAAALVFAAMIGLAGSGIIHGSKGAVVAARAPASLANHGFFQPVAAISGTSR